MTRAKALGPDNREAYTYIELPIGATAIGLPSERYKTGLWRYTKPAHEEKIPPCQLACPMGNWIQRFVIEMGSGNLEEAWKSLKLENPFPGVSGRVCYHPCEESCNRKEIDASTGIQAIERCLADHFFNKPIKPSISRKKQGKRVAVVGSGPAGLACAYFLTLIGYEVTVFEALEELGGIPQIGIPEFRLPKDILNKEIGDILELGIEVKRNCRVGEDIEFTELLDYDAVFLATGAHKSPKLNVPGETIKGVYKGLDFLSHHNLNKPMNLGERIMVIGGGNTAIDVVRTILRLGRQPLILYRRTRHEMPAFCEEVDEAIEEGIRIQYLLSPVAIRGSEKEGFVVECNKMKKEGVDSDGRARVVPLEGECVPFRVDQIILATGEAPDFSYLPRKFRITNGSLWVSEWGQTNIEKVFAGGDIIDQPWTVSEAIGSAKRAAIAMDHYLRGRDLAKISKQGKLARTMREHLRLDEQTVSEKEKVTTLEDLNLVYRNPSTRHKPRRVPPAERTRNFNEVNLGLSLETASEEAKRCLSCGICCMCGNCYLFCPDGAVQLDSKTGRYTINYEYCKGCGICQNECPVGAIVMEREGE